VRKSGIAGLLWGWQTGWRYERRLAESVSQSINSLVTLDSVASADCQ